MLKRLCVVILAVVALALVPLAASADHTSCHALDCDPNPCNGTIGGFHVSHGDGTVPARVTVPTVSAGVIVPITDAARGPLYLDVRDLASDIGIFSIWIYQETNTVLRLQRGGHSIFPDTPATTGQDPCTEAGGTAANTCDTTKPTCHDQAIF